MMAVKGFAQIPPSASRELKFTLGTPDQVGGRLSPVNGGGKVRAPQEISSPACGGGVRQTPDLIRGKADGGGMHL